MFRTELVPEAYFLFNYQTNESAVGTAFGFNSRTHGVSLEFSSILSISSVGLILVYLNRLSELTINKAAFHYYGGGGNWLLIRWFTNAVTWFPNPCGRKTHLLPGIGYEILLILEWGNKPSSLWRDLQTDNNDWNHYLSSYYVHGR